MPDPRALLSLEVPIVVVLGERTMRAGDLLALGPGSILELPKRADDQLELLLNNRSIGHGDAVKVGEKFGLRITAIGPKADRLRLAAEDPSTRQAQAEAA